MPVRVALVLLALAPLVQAQNVQKVNGPLVGNVTCFAWTPEGSHILYGAKRDSPDIDAITSVRVADGDEVVYDPYASYFYFTAYAQEFVFLPDPELVGVRYST